jgi:hypothetical protein
VCLAQLLRTPRFFQLMRDGLAADRTSYEQDTLPRVMLILIARWIPRLARMRGILPYNETGLPLLTCDNPPSRGRRAAMVSSAASINTILNLSFLVRCRQL